MNKEVCDESQVTVDKTELDKLKKKYPSVNPTKIEKQIIDKCKYYSKISQDDLEAKFGFENGKKSEYLEGIKDSIVLIQFDYKKPKTKVTREDAKNKIKEIIEKEKPKKKYTPVTLEAYKEVLHNWFYFTDDEIIDIKLATLIAEKIPGDPLWMFVIAPPGALKTETLRPFTLSEDFYPLSDLTSKTFVSGLTLGTGKTRTKVKDLLPQLDKKVLIFKDFTTILEKGRDERREIIAQLREIYDGSFAKKFGTMDYAIRHDARFGFIAGVTPIIDKHWKIMQQLGERFLKVRWEENIKKVTTRAREIEGQEIKMRKELQATAMGFVTNLNFKKLPTFDDNAFGETLDGIAEFVAIGRTPISISSTQQDFYFDFIPTPERPTRLVKQFKKMCKCLAFIRGKREVDLEELETVGRIARDTFPQERLKTLQIIQENETKVSLEGCPRPLIYKKLRLPDMSTKRILMQLKLLDLIEEKVVVNQDYSSYEKRDYYYKIKNSSAPYPLTYVLGKKKVGGEPAHEISKGKITKIA